MTEPHQGQQPDPVVIGWSGATRRRAISQVTAVTAGFAAAAVILWATDHGLAAVLLGGGGIGRGLWLVLTTSRCTHTLAFAHDELTVTRRTLTRERRVAVASWAHVAAAEVVLARRQAWLRLTPTSTADGPLLPGRDWAWRRHTRESVDVRLGPDRLRPGVEPAVALRPLRDLRGLVELVLAALEECAPDVPASDATGSGARPGALGVTAPEEFNVPPARARAVLYLAAGVLGAGLVTTLLRVEDLGSPAARVVLFLAGAVALVAGLGRGLGLLMGSHTVAVDGVGLHVHAVEGAARRSATLSWGDVTAVTSPESTAAGQVTVTVTLRDGAAVPRGQRGLRPVPRARQKVFVVLPGPHLGRFREAVSRVAPALHDGRP